jgi:hypothetical protein
MRTGTTTTTTTTTTTDGKAIALKVSWNEATGNVVRRECDTLRELAGVPHIPRCLALLPYPSSSFLDGGEEETTTTSAKTRTMMALEPVVDDVVASMDDLVDPHEAVHQIVETTVEMLRRGVYIVDVQWLLSSNDSSSVVTFIDFTERTDDPVAFLTEVVAGIPTRWRSAARLAFQQQQQQQMMTATMQGGETRKIPPASFSSTTSNDVDRAKFDETMEMFEALLADE